MVFTRKTKEQNIKGYVVPVDWDNDDSVIEISIQTDNDDYEVGQNGLGRELLEFLDKEVEVTGMVEVQGGENFISIISYEVIEETEYEDDEEYEEVDEEEYEEGDEEEYEEE